jgi:HupE / UreJ protein
LKGKLIAVAAVLLSVGGVASAHRLDEYLQATILSVEKDHVRASMRLIPGVAVSSSVIASIDSNGDGTLSSAEEHAYAEKVLGELFLSVDGNSVRPRLVSVAFPQIEQMREGLGEIHIEFTADLPRGGGNRRLVLENHHLSATSAYLVNTVVPRDPGIRIVSQKRNEQQSFYELDYEQAVGNAEPEQANGWANFRFRISSVGFLSLFRLGMRHIAEGSDHLLFLLALLLPAPLVVSGSHWAGSGGVRRSLLRMLEIVTAFTVGHSTTLVLAALGFVHVPSRPVEVLIAFSILISAIHAVRPIFPGKEAVIAAFFGLIHGLAFATTLGNLGLGRWERVSGVLAFNLGIETMQMIVVGVTLPSLILLSRSRAYSFLRLGGALFAGFASLGWIAERLFGVHHSVDFLINNIAHHAGWIAGALFLLSLICRRPGSAIRSCKIFAGRYLRYRRNVTSAIAIVKS